MRTFLDFEKPIADLEGKIEELRHLTGIGEEINVVDEITSLQGKKEKLARQIYQKLDPMKPATAPSPRIRRLSAASGASEAIR
jgi:acetyl-CoA carboxylase alpha subunit